LKKTKKLTVGDWVRIRKVGIDGAYQIIKMDLDDIICEQNDDGYRHRIKVDIEDLIKL
jgi:hypothetical protein